MIPRYFEIRPKNKKSIRAWKTAIEAEEFDNWLLDVLFKHLLSDGLRIMGDLEVKNDNN